MNTEAVQYCPKCQAPIPTEAPQGLCPQCLLAAASLPTEPSASGPVPFPSLESIAAGFPQLEIIEFIGKGGMGLVFKARQPKLDRFVALKLLPQKPGADPAFCERFHREARVLAKLSHPNIVAVHDFGEAGPFFYLLMEFVDGVNLRQAMRAGRFTPAEALAIVPRICDALQYAHEEGVLHRDIKPENLLLDSRGRVKIGDFGIAKILGDANDITLTARGLAIGTPHYMAPEQLEKPQDVDARADVYSLGVVFYEMLTGELPIGRFAPPSEKAEMDPRVDKVVLRTLEKERERRFQSAGDVKTQVEHITATGAAAGTPKPAGAPPPPPVITDEPKAHRTAQPPWSVRALLSAGLVGVSLVLFSLAAVAGNHVGPGDVGFFLTLIGVPALCGTFLAWRTLRRLQADDHACRGKRLVLVSAVAWPLLVVNLIVLFVLFLLLATVQWQLFHVSHGGLARSGVVAGALGLLGFDFFVLRRWLRLWNAERILPQSEVRGFLDRVPRGALWASGIGGGVLFMVLMTSYRHLDQTNALEQPAPAQSPNAPPGFEVPVGEVPGNEGRTYRSSAMVPAGYALTLITVLCRDQVVTSLPNGSAVLMAPAGRQVQGLFTWRLLGITTFADGAPLQLSLGAGPENSNEIFHVVPPQPITIDWVGEPAQLWPPQSGHTMFLLMRGWSANPGPEPQPATEWVLGIQGRLDPIPPDLLRNIDKPTVILGTNWAANFESAISLSSSPTNSAVEVSPETLAEYNKVCSSLADLATAEKILRAQFTDEHPTVTQLRQQMAAARAIKQGLEVDHPGLTLLRREGRQPPAAEQGE